MAILRIILALWFLPLMLGATNYYVKTGGSDGAAGTSDITAWATITRVNTAWANGVFAPGDNILFRRGDTWSGTITVTESGTAVAPIVISAYDTGELPIIEGFVTLSSWTVYSGNISYATLTGESATEMVTINGTQYAMGRYPNLNNWLTVASRLSSTQITVTGLTGTPNWVGAELVNKENRWIIRRHPITAHSTNTLTFTYALEFDPTGYGVFIQNSLLTLDAAGEWYHDHSANRLYMHTSHTSTVRASAIDYGVNVGGYENIVISNLNLRGFNKTAVDANYAGYAAHGLKVDGCNISFMGRDAIFINRSSCDTVSNNTISYTNNCAVTMWGNYGTYCSITGNDISHTGEVYGAALTAYPVQGSAGNAYAALYINPNNSTISGNRITYTGYLPVNFRGTNSLVQNNFISHYCYVKDDGGGIYVYGDNSTGKRVLNNIILYGLGAQQGVTDPSVSAHGLYTDGESSNCYWSGNIVGYVIGAGYHGNRPQNVQIVNNKFFECGEFLNMWKYFADGQYLTGLRITQNHFVSSQIEETLPAVVDYHNSSGQYYGGNLDTEIAHFGNIDSNYYYINTECAAFIKTASAEAAPRSMQRWRTLYGHDTHSTFVTMSGYTLNSIGSNLLTNGAFDSSIDGWSAVSLASASWNNGALGDGGCIQMSSTQANYNFFWWANTNTITTAISGGAINSSNHYILRFLGRSAIAEKTIALKLYSTGTGSYLQRFFTVGSTNTQKDVLFSYPATVSSGATMRLALCDDPVTTYMDNVGLYVANVTLTDWDSYLHLIYNDSTANKTYYMSATMTDPGGVTHNSVTLAPQDGMILMGIGSISEGSNPSVNGFGKVGTKFGKHGGKFVKKSEL